jgi:hypothetical protein
MESSSVTTAPTPATGQAAAVRLHFTDPRITPLAQTAQAASADDDRPWRELDWHQQHAWRTAARDWLRAAVTLGLLPLVLPSTGEALAAVALDVHPGDGRPRVGSRGRAQAFRDAAHAVRPEAFGYGGPDHYDAWTDAAQRLQAIAKEEEASVGDYLSADQIHAALVRVEAWADQLDDAARAAAGRHAGVTDPVAAIIRGLLDGGRHGEDPA